MNREGLATRADRVRELHDVLLARLIRELSLENAPNEARRIHAAVDAALEPLQREAELLDRADIEASAAPSEIGPHDPKEGDERR